MRLFGMKVDSLDDLFVHELEDLYNAEKQVEESLPKMIDAAGSPELRHNFEEHLNVTKDQIRRLEDVFRMMDIEPKGEKCEGMAGLIAEGEEIVKMDAPSDVKDAALIGAAQKVEHYEISSYGTARTFARVLGRQDVADKLQQTLGQEKSADQQLTELAERSINIEAAGGG